MMLKDAKEMNGLEALEMLLVASEKKQYINRLYELAAEAGKHPLEYVGTLWPTTPKVQPVDAPYAWRYPFPERGSIGPFLREVIASDFDFRGINDKEKMKEFCHDERLQDMSYHQMSERQQAAARLLGDRFMDWRGTRRVA